MSFSVAGLPLLVGASPGLQLFDADGDCTVVASIWRVDWSVRGRGPVLVLWRPGEVTVWGADRGLSGWLAEDFVRHFPEVKGLAWAEPRYLREEPWISLDLRTGLSAFTADVQISLREPIAVRAVAEDRFTLGDQTCRLSLVLAPCAVGEIWIAGRRLAGEVRRNGTTRRPMSSAFLAEAEVWQAAR